MKWYFFPSFPQSTIYRTSHTCPHSTWTTSLPFYVIPLIFCLFCSPDCLYISLYVFTSPSLPLSIISHRLIIINVFITNGAVLPSSSLASHLCKFCFALHSLFISLLLLPFFSLFLLISSNSRIVFALVYLEQHAQRFFLFVGLSLGGLLVNLLD